VRAARAIGRSTQFGGRSIAQNLQLADGNRRQLRWWRNRTWP